MTTNHHTSGGGAAATIRSLGVVLPADEDSTVAVLGGPVPTAKTPEEIPITWVLPWDPTASIWPIFNRVLRVTISAQISVIDSFACPCVI